MATESASAGGNRLFIPQEQLDLWLSEESVELDGEILRSLREELGIEGSFRITMALLFVEEIAGGGDEHSLVGTVKDMEQLQSLGGEHCAGSVILGDNAYEVIEGFAGIPLASPSAELVTESITEPVAVAEPEKVATGGSLADVMGAVVGEPKEEGGGELDLLARFFLQRK